MNWLDRLVAAVSPRAAVAREARRMQLSEVQRVRASRGKRFHDPLGSSSDWERNTGRVEDALPVRAISRRRIRRLLATNPYAAKVRNTLLNNLVGFGIVGTPVKGTPRRVTDAWKLWLRHCDWLGQLDFNGLQELAVGTMVGEGECFIVRRYDRGKAGVVPTRIEVLDGEMLVGAGPEGKSIEYDEAGRALRYHFRARRSSGSFSNQTVTFPAADVIHLFRRDWPGQQRGVSQFEPVVKRFEDLDEYIDAELVRKKIEACFAAFVTPSEEAAAEGFDVGGQSEDETFNDFDIEVLEPGMIQRLRPGDTVQFGDPKPSAAIGEFSRVTLLGATAGAGVPYEHGTGDLSNVNYSSYRAGSLEFQRFCGRLQWLLIIPGMLERIWDWFCEDGWQAGMFAKRFYEIGWTPPAFESIDRKKDADADVLEVGAGLNSLRKVVGARGENFEDLMREIAEDRALLATLGLDDLLHVKTAAGSGGAAGDGEAQGSDGNAT